MSNRVSVRYVKILKLEDDGTASTGEDAESFGWLISDDYQDHFDSGYGTFEELQEVFRKETLVSFLRRVSQSDLTNHVVDRGVYFNDDWIDGDKLKEMQKDEEDDES